MKNVLVITYYWPPAGGGGVQRIAKFCKYLPEFGWRPWILTVKDGNYEYQDNGLLSDVKNISSVLRAPSREPHRFLNRLKRRKALDASQARKLPSRSRKLIRILGEILRLNLFVPDSRIGWLGPARTLGKHLMEKESFDLIFSSAPPYTTHLIARRLKREFGIPWTADFRDPWLENLAYNTVPRLPLVKHITRKMEHSVLQEANTIVTVGGHLQELLQSKLSPKEKGKCTVITNGYDPTDLPPETKTCDRFCLSYFGTVYPDGFPHSLIAAIDGLLKTDSAFANDFLFQLAGKIPREIQVRLGVAIPEHNLRVLPYLSHGELSPLLHQRQLLLLLVNDVPFNELIITGKIFEYLPTGNPVLGIGPQKGDAAAILGETGTGEMLDADDTEGIAGFLSRNYAAWKNESLGTPPRSFPKFERRNLTRELAEIFDRTCASSDRR